MIIATGGKPMSTIHISPAMMQAAQQLAARLRASGQSEQEIEGFPGFSVVHGEPDEGFVALAKVEGDEEYSLCQQR
jgi:hypothetical protein